MTVRAKWKGLLEHAAEIVGSYDTGVTLRQLFYRLVADGSVPNTRSWYQELSKHVADARREGWFPDLTDNTRRIEVPPYYDSPEDVMNVVTDTYRRDRMEGQDHALYIGCEKDGMVAQLSSWFGDRGIPVVPFVGAASYKIERWVPEDAEERDVPGVMFYAGDYDPTGDWIPSDFERRTGGAVEVVRVALTEEQVEAWELPTTLEPDVLDKVTRDPRRKRFVELHNTLTQVEVDAIPPDQLRDLFEAAIAPYWDANAYQYALDAEAADLERLREITEALG